MRLTHEQIWRGIDKLAAHADTSPSGLARRAGLDATTFNPSKRFSADGRKPRWPSTESLAKALSAANMGFEDFAALVTGTGARHSLPGLCLAEDIAISAFDASGRPAGTGWQHVPFPGVDLDDAFALTIEGDGMAPVFRPGATLVVSQSDPARPGDRVLVKHRDGRITGWTLGRHTVQTVELRPLDPAGAGATLPLVEIDWIARIVWASQ